MVTMVGNEEGIKDLVTNLISLEHDAIGACESCIERVDNEALSARIAEFKQDHLQPLDVLRRIAAETGSETPVGSDMKQMLTIGKIVLADLIGDAATLKAMTTNEDDTVAAYERASWHPDAIPESKAFFTEAHQDALRHREWMEAKAQSV